MAITKQQLTNVTKQQRGVTKNIAKLYAKASPQQKGVLAKAKRNATQSGAILATCGTKRTDSLGRNYKSGRNSGDKDLCSDAGKQLKKADIITNKIFKKKFFGF